MKIKTGDEIIVISGKYKGKKGIVLKKINGNKFLVEGINIVKKHIRSNPKKGIDGGIHKKESPIESSNIAIYNPISKLPDRVGFQFLKNGKKIRCFKSNKKEIIIK